MIRVGFTLPNIGPVRVHLQLRPHSSWLHAE